MVTDLVETEPRRPRFPLQGVRLIPGANGTVYLAQQLDNWPWNLILSETTIGAGASTIVDNVRYDGSNGTPILDHSGVGHSPVVLARMTADAITVGIPL